MGKFGMGTTGMAALLMAVAAATAADKSDFSRDQAVFEAASAPAMEVGGDAEYLSSMKKNGRVTIGGDVIVRYAYTRLKATDGRFATQDQRIIANEANPFVGYGNSTFHANTWEPDTTDLTIKVAACDNGSLTMKLDLTDPWTDTYHSDGLLKELYFTMENLCGSNLGFKLGKQRVPFGMVKDVLAIDAYMDMDNGGRTFLNTYRNGKKQANGANGDFDAFNMEPPHSAKYHRRYAFIPYFKTDKARFELSVFQDRRDSPFEPTPRSGRDNSGTRDTNDPGLSFSGKATFNPIETLELSASVVTRYNRSADLYSDGDVRGDDRMWATSLAFDWNPCLFGRKFNFFGEWQHAWRPGDFVDKRLYATGDTSDPLGTNGAWRQFIDKTSSDDIHAGLAVDVTEAVTLHAQYEWLRGRWNDHDSRTDMHRAIFAGKYTFVSGMFAELGYQREWGRTRTRSLNTHASAYVDVFYTATGWSF